MASTEPTQSKDENMVPAAKFEDHCWKDVIPAEDMELYSNYARDTFVGPRAAVVAIDLYNLVYSGGARPPYELQKDHPNSCGIYAHQAIEPTQALLAAARRAGLPIFFATKDVADHNRPAHAISTKRKQHPVAAEGYDIHDAFEVHAEDVIIRKQRASIFHGTPLLSHLNLLGIGSLIVCGEVTSGCVRASVVDAFSAGLHVSIVEECTFDRAPLTHKVNLFDMHHKYADVMHLEDVLAHLAVLERKAA
jgi:maleamate amidohydrolase